MSRRLILNIRGTNGSGKSSIVMGMMNDPQLYIIEKPYHGKLKKIATVFPSYGWIALGTYFNKTGGLDGFPNNELTIKSFWYILKKYPDYSLILEGFLASGLFSTYQKLFEEVEYTYDQTDTKVIVLGLMPPLNTCLERVYKRNGGKPIKEKNVESKWKAVDHCLEKFKQIGIETIVWDNTKEPPKKLKHYKPIYKLIELSEKARKETKN